ncbi:hypothetical protein RI054_06g31840 [Pseudoscourfieldia marina]
MTFAPSSLVFYAWLLLTLHAATVCANFHLGDYVPTARRGQFHGTRTSWHDALGRHAPRFGMDRTVAMPIPRPESFQPGDEYKLSLAFEGEHFVTPWLRVLGGNLDKLNTKSAEHAPIPMVQVRLTRTHDKMVSVRAHVVPLPLAYAREHVDLLDEFYNATAWPKHVIVRYEWNERRDVSPLQGEAVLFVSTAALALVVVFSAFRRAGVGSSVAELVASAADDGPSSARRGVAGPSSHAPSAGDKGD